MNFIFIRFKAYVFCFLVACVLFIFNIFMWAIDEFSFTRTDKSACNNKKDIAAAIKVSLIFLLSNNKNALLMKIIRKEEEENEHHTDGIALDATKLT